MNTRPEALRLAGLLETDGWPDAAAELRRLHEENQAIRQALAQPEQEPVAWRWKERINSDFDSWVISVSEPPPYAIEKQPLYAAPPKREPLMTKYVIDLWDEYGLDPIKFAREIEAAHGIKENT